MARLHPCAVQACPWRTEHVQSVTARVQRGVPPSRWSMTARGPKQRADPVPRNLAGIERISTLDGELRRDPRGPGAR